MFANTAAGSHAGSWRRYVYVGRGIGRAFLTGVALGPLAISISLAVNLPDAEKLPALAGVAIGTIIFLLVLRWFGEGHGILHGASLAVLSLGFTNGIVGVVATVVRLLMWAGGADIDWDEFIATGVLSAILLPLCNWGLLRFDVQAGWRP